MDKTDTATETLVEVKVEKETQSEKKVEQTVVKEAPPINSQYLSNFENLTVADIKREEEKVKEEEAKKMREALLEAERAEVERKREVEEQALQEEEKSAKSTNVIEKPNYDLIEENKKIVKLKKRTASKRMKKKKTAALILACALGASAIVCVTNTIILDQMNSYFVQLEDSYKLNLQRYLQNISNLDATKKGMEVIETYPEDLLDAGDIGKKSNWFDKICDFLGGLFGG